MALQPCILPIKTSDEPADFEFDRFPGYDVVSGRVSPHHNASELYRRGASADV